MGNDDEVKQPSSGGDTPRVPRRTTRSAPAKKAAEVPVQKEKANTDLELAARSRNLFLRDVEKQLAKKELYNLDEEFEKTRHNRSPLVWLTVLIFTAIMILVAVLVTSYIQDRSQQVPINIASFEDVNLRDILDKSKQLDITMQNAKRTLADLQTGLQTDIQDAQGAAAQQIELANNQAVSADQKQARITAIQQQLAGQIANIRAQYAPKIAAANQAIADTQKQMDQYDARQVQQAKQQAAVLNNQQRLFDMQMNKTVTYYEARIKDLNDQFTGQIESIKLHNDQLVNLMKRNQAAEVANLIATYNPTITSSDITAILTRPITNPAATADNFSRVLVANGALPASSFTDLQASVQDFGTLLARLQQVPYKNSVPPALDHLQALNREIVNSYQRVANGLATLVTSRDQQIAGANKTIDEYNQALSSLIRNSRENGYVIDARETSNLVVFIDSIYTVADGAPAYVFRQDNQQIATIRLHVTAAGVYGTLDSLSKSDVPMQPFDKILLDVKQ